MRERPPNARAGRALSQAIVARVLMKDDRKQKGTKEIAGNAISHGSSKPLCVALRALSKSRVIVHCLCHTGIKGGSDERDRLKGVADKQPELLSWGKSAD